MIKWEKVGDITYKGGVYTITKIQPHRWDLCCSNGRIGKYKTLKEAKTLAEELEEHYAKKFAPRAIVRAFTGLIIGEFDIVYENNKIIVLSTPKGNMSFDKKVGVQAGTKKDVFSNTIEKI